MEFIRACLQRLLIRVGASPLSLRAAGQTGPGLQMGEKSEAFNSQVFVVSRVSVFSFIVQLDGGVEKTQKRKLAEGGFAEGLHTHPPSSASSAHSTLLSLKRRRIVVAWNSARRLPVLHLLQPSPSPAPPLLIVLRLLLHFTLSAMKPKPRRLSENLHKHSAVIS